MISNEMPQRYCRSLFHDLGFDRWTLTRDNLIARIRDQRMVEPASVPPVSSKTGKVDRMTGTLSQRFSERKTVRTLVNSVPTSRRTACD